MAFKIICSSKATARHFQSGNTLMATLCVTIIIGLALVGYLRLTTSQHRLTVRSQVWNSCMPVVEAGIDEALTHCTYNYSTNMKSNGWVKRGLNYVKTNGVGDGYYDVEISISLPYEITSRGYYPMPDKSTFVSRVVHVTTTNMGLFTGALLVRNDIDLNGNSVLTDSFDSQDDTKSTNARYDPTKAGDKGDIACNGVGNSAGVDVGNANVWGHVYTKPTGSLVVGSKGAVGSVSWQKSGVAGVEPGWWNTDLNVSYPSVAAPFTTGTMPTGGMVGTNTYTHILGNDKYVLSSLGGKVIVTGKATLYVTGDINFGFGDSLEIAAGGSLTIYAAGANTEFNSVVNPNSSATSLSYFGLPSNTRIRVSGNAALTAAIYAPSADFIMNGSADVYGSIVANSATLVGNAAFHYDEALLDIPPNRACVVTSWNEL